jgi:hypothetical protein
MSKDKGGKNVKKAAVAGGNKKVSDYQAGKLSKASNNILDSQKKT